MLSFLRGHPLFFRFWMSIWCSELGDWIRNMTLMYMVLELSNHSAVAVSINMFAEFAPIFLFGPLVGVLADRWRRKGTIVGAFLFRALMLGVFILALLFESLLLIYIGAFLSSIGTLFFRAPGNAFTMMLVEPEQRKTAASMRQISSSSLAMIGAPLGTMFYFTVGGEVALGISVLLLVIGALLVSSIKVEEEQRKSERGVKAVFGEMKSGFRYAANHPMLRAIISSMMFFSFAGGLVNVLVVFIVTEFLGLSKEWFGAVATIQGAGMLVASLLLGNGKLKISTERMIPLGLLLIGISLFGLVLQPIYWLSAASLLVLSFGQVILNIGVATLMQTKVEMEYQGRSTMIASTCYNGVLVTAMLLSGWLHKFWPVDTIVSIGGGVILVGCLMLTLMLSRATQHYEQQQQQQQAVPSVKG